MWVLTAIVFASAWQVVEQSDGAQVEARAISDRPYREHRVSVHVPLAVEQMDTYFRDGFRKLYDKRATRRVVVATADRAVFHDRIKLPVGMDRDYVLEMLRRFDPETRVLEWRFRGIEHDAAPRSDDCVRMPALYGEWVIAPASDGGADLTYVVYSDPGGDFPRAMVASTQARAALDRVKLVVADAKAKHGVKK